ncbi:MAG: hypothetical protein GX557_16055, partial [Chloroflexi bacterium]|nr:hypothetical protein [Chloroflexota bacterium]
MGFGTLPIIILPFMLLLIVLIFVTLNRYIRYKERVALAQLGFSLDDMSRADAAGRRGNRGVLWGGVITATSGLALLLGLSTLGIGAWLLAGLLPLFVGLGMVLIYYMTMGAEPRSTSAQPPLPGKASADAGDGEAEAELGADTTV